MAINEDSDAPGGKCLTVGTSGVSIRSSISLDVLGEGPVDSDSLILVRQRGRSTVTASYVGLVARGRGVSGSEYGTCGLLGSSSEGGTVVRNNYVAPAAAVTQNSPAGWEDGELCWLRLTVAGDSAVARVYPYNDPKGTPIGTHSLSPTDPDGSVKRTGIFWFSSNTDADILWYGIGTEGDEAPLPDNWGVEAPQGTATVTNVSAGLNSATVTYSYNEFDAEGFEYRLGAGNPSTIGASPATITGLTPGTSYTLQVRAVNVAGESDWSEGYPFQTAEGPTQVPQGTVTVNDIATTAATATVDYSYGPDDAEGFEYRIEPSSTWQTLGPSPFEIGGLTPNTSYTIQTRAVNSVGGGASSSTVFETDEAGVALEVVWDIDAGCVDPTTVNVINPESDEPIIELSPRRTAGGNNPGVARWIHFYFKLENAEGKRPIFRVNVNSRWTNHESASYQPGWRPVFTTDHVGWEQAPSRTIVSNIAEWQFSEPFDTHEVYVADHPTFRLQDFNELAQVLATDTSGLVTPSAGGAGTGVIGTSPNETDDLSRQVGGNDLYGFVLGDSRPTDDGGPKRWMVVDCGIHPGERLDGFPLKGIIDFYLNGTGPAAEKMRANWRVGVYFALTPNGIKGGHWRSNWRVTKDPNRDWGGTGSFTMVESIRFRDAILADLSGAVPDVCVSLHTAAARETVFNIFDNSASRPDPTVQNAWLTALDDVAGAPRVHVSNNIPESVTGWYTSLGAPVTVISEFGTRTSTPVGDYIEAGKQFLEATAAVDAQGLFYDSASGGSESSVTVTAQGQGLATEHAVGGSAASVAVVAVGAGLTAEVAQGGSTAQVAVSAQGAGFAGSDQTGGSTSDVTVSAVGAGTGHESAQGGSTASVSVSAQGSGIPSTGQSGGSTSNVIVLATGQGFAEEHASGGSAAGVKVTAAGAGESSEGQSNQGGSTAQILVFPSGSGVAIERAEGGSSAQVWVRASGYTPPSFDGPAILFEVLAEGRVAILDGKRA